MVEEFSNPSITEDKVVEETNNHFHIPFYCKTDQGHDTSKRGPTLLTNFEVNSIENQNDNPHQQSWSPLQTTPVQDSPTPSPIRSSSSNQVVVWR